MNKILLMLFSLIFVFALSCNPKDEITDSFSSNERLVWLEYKLAKSNEFPIFQKKGKAIRLILENAFGGNNYILGIFDLGDQYLVYQKEINNLSSSYSSHGLLFDETEFELIWNQINLLSDNLKPHELVAITDGSKRIIDASIWTLEMNSLDGGYINQIGIIDEKTTILLKEIYSSTVIPWPIERN